MSNSLAKNRFKSILDRAFERFFDIYLIKCFLSDPSLQNVNLPSFKAFRYDDPNFDKCLQAYQESKGENIFTETATIKDLDDAITGWYSNNSKLISEFKNEFKENKLISESDFIKFYKDDKVDRYCDYCKIKESEIDFLIKENKIFTKRLATRGKFMEVDRIKPNEAYVEGNLALSCYWCNNAKTDEFTAEEFKPIGLAIGKVLRARK
jgi:5-methylcytosine-specific restriction endonuclease McrA